MAVACPSAPYSSGRFFRHFPLSLRRSDSDMRSKRLSLIGRLPAFTEDPQAKHGEPETAIFLSPGGEGGPRAGRLFSRRSLRRRCAGHEAVSVPSRVAGRIAGFQLPIVGGYGLMLLAAAAHTHQERTSFPVLSGRSPRSDRFPVYRKRRSCPCPVDSMRIPC